MDEIQKQKKVKSARLGNLLTAFIMIGGGIWMLVDGIELEIAGLGIPLTYAPEILIGLGILVGIFAVLALSGKFDDGVEAEMEASKNKNEK